MTRSTSTAKFRISAPGKRRRWQLAALAACLGLLVFVWGIDAFLAVSLPVDANVLVVEGWIWESSAMTEAAEEFKRGRYTWLVTVGPTASGKGGAGDQKSAAELAASRLRDLGVDRTRIVVLPGPNVKRHQTYSSAVALRNWFRESKTEAIGVNVFTLGTHARKSLVLFRRALGPGVDVGVVAGKEDTYDSRQWWLSARGIYVVSRKTIGYLYAVLWPLPRDGFP